MSYTVTYTVAQTYIMCRNICSAIPIPFVDSLFKYILLFDHFNELETQTHNTGYLNISKIQVALLNTQSEEQNSSVKRRQNSYLVYTYTTFNKKLQ